MKRLIGCATLVATLAAAGCSAGAESYPKADTTANVPVATVEIPTLPDQLPRSVEEASSHAVAIKVGAIVNQGSGVRIDGRYVLTAGHVVQKDRPDNYTKISENCENLGAIDNGAPNGRSAFEERLAATYTPPNEEDVAGFSLSPMANGLQPIPELPIGKGVTDGEIVYFVNYEPTDSEGPRIPSSEGQLGKPAIYGGVVMEHTNGRATVLTGLKSYGAIEGDHSRKGGSGGAVFNDGGELIGLLVTGSVHTDLSSEDVLIGAGVKPIGSGVEGDTELSYSGLQLVDPASVNNLRQRIDSAAPCNF